MCERERTLYIFVHMYADIYIYLYLCVFTLCFNSRCLQRKRPVGERWPFQIGTSVNTCASQTWGIRLRPAVQPVLFAVWLTVVSHHRDPGCYSPSFTLCKHMDPTDGNIVPLAPEQVTWRAANEVRQHPPTLQNKNSHQTRVWAMTMWLIVAMVIWPLR